jgi:hypothetical protein
LPTKENTMNKFQRALTWLLCCLLLALAPAYVGAQPANAPGANSFTGSASVPDRVTFTTTGSMNGVCQLHTATLLNNGKVLMAGGNNLQPDLASAHLYDPATGTWSTTGNMSDARRNHTATLLNDGKVLVTGGSSNGSYLASAELYDPATGAWTTTGSMNAAHYAHTATLLNNGKVLVAGGASGSSRLASAELYDPATGTWSTTGSTNAARYAHTATLLNDGKVLVAGGYNGSSSLASAELYDPATGTFTTTGSMNVARGGHTATLLNNGKVLVAGVGAELYDPATGTFTTTGSMNVARSSHTATLLNNGKVLVAGGYGGSYLASTELYDPATGTWSTTGSMNVAHTYHAATLLNNGKVLVVQGFNGFGDFVGTELGTLMPSNIFTGTLTLPSGWLTNTVISAQFVGTSSAAAINAGALSNDNMTWGSWITVTSDVTATTTWTVSGEGANKPVYLRLRDVNDQVATVVSGTVNVDTTAPQAQVNALSVFQTSKTFSVTWAGADVVSGSGTLVFVGSGLASIDVQFREGASGTWTDWLTATNAISATFSGQDGHTYFFRARAWDNAGNVSAYSSGDTQTTVDVTPPAPGSLIINGGALNATAISVTLSLSATDATSGVALASFSNDGTAWSAWQSYATQAGWSLLSGDGLKTVYARFRDVAGNVSSSVSNTIGLDTAAGAEYGVTINDGALFTNQIAVILTISARPGTAQVRVSNDGGFAGAPWEPYASRKAWAIVQPGGSYARVVYVRYKDLGGNVSATSQDDIILDVTPPVGSISVATPTVTSTLVIVTLHLNASDDVSGVGAMRLSDSQSFSGATWQAYSTTAVWPVTGEAVYVQYRDNAGNVSPVYSATLPGEHRVYLPVVVR